MTSKRRRKPPLENGWSATIGIYTIEGFDNPVSDVMEPEDWKGRLRDVSEDHFLAMIRHFKGYRAYRYLSAGAFYYRSRYIGPLLYFTPEFFLRFRKNDIFCLPQSLSCLPALLDPTAYRHPVAYLQAVDAVSGPLLLSDHEFVQVSWMRTTLAYEPFSVY